jgi:hypothetical protein
VLAQVHTVVEDANDNNVSLDLSEHHEMPGPKNTVWRTDAQPSVPEMIESDTLRKVFVRSDADTIGVSSQVPERSRQQPAISIGGSPAESVLARFENLGKVTLRPKR